MYVDCSNCTVLIIRNNVIAGNVAEDSGGGICCWHSSPAIQKNRITANSANNAGGGLYCDNSSPAIESNIITHKPAARGGSSTLRVAGRPWSFYLAATIYLQLAVACLWTNYSVAITYSSAAT